MEPEPLEQRNGRIDRHGQKAKQVLVYHFVGKGYKERQRPDVRRRRPATSTPTWSS